MNKEKEARAIQYLRSFEPEDEPYYLCYSGGKDSDVIRILASLAGVRHEIHHNLTTVDAPETVWYVKSIPGVIVDRPEKTMWQLIVQKMMPPTRLVRYCCAGLKERCGTGRMKITGVRWEESKNRGENQGVINIIGKKKTMKKTAKEFNVDFTVNKKNGIVMNNDNAESRRFVEHCYRTTATMVNPIVDWTEQDVWEFLRYYGCTSNPLYQCGMKRIGCIGCPMAGSQGQKRGFIRWPKYRALYVHTFERMLENRAAKGLPAVWRSGEDVMRWWVGDDPDQLQLDFE